MSPSFRYVSRQCGWNGDSDSAVATVPMIGPLHNLHTKSSRDTLLSCANCKLPSCLMLNFTHFGVLRAVLRERSLALLCTSSPESSILSWMIPSTNDPSVSTVGAEGLPAIVKRAIELCISLKDHKVLPQTFALLHLGILQSYL